MVGLVVSTRAGALVSRASGKCTDKVCGMCLGRCKCRVSVLLGSVVSAWLGTNVGSLVDVVQSDERSR